MVPHSLIVNTLCVITRLRPAYILSSSTMFSTPTEEVSYWCTAMANLSLHHPASCALVPYFLRHGSLLALREHSLCYHQTPPRTLLFFLLIIYTPISRLNSILIDITSLLHDQPLLHRWAHRIAAATKAYLPIRRGSC
jgi:hypothetical protein